MTAPTTGQVEVTTPTSGQVEVTTPKYDGCRSYFTDGSDEVVLSDGRRVEMRSVIEALVLLCEINGIPFAVRKP